MRAPRPPVAQAAPPPAPPASPVVPAPPGPPDDSLVRATLAGSHDAFEELLRRHQPRVFATARRYARRESEVADIVQEVFLKAYERLPGFRFEAPFDHWLMRVAIRTCYDFLRAHQRTRERSFSDLTDAEDEWLDRYRVAPDTTTEDADAARALVQRLLESLPPQFRLVIQLLEIEERSIREIQQLTGWSIPLIKVRAFRARAAMRRQLRRLRPAKYL
ncbi:MAG: sigma-70 family RNA polymerase sigma factor [Verrucomicrobiales bacterium]|nr:sigma-70 family RNA polymerase sigma factor [Verrucomicrobiales bacterium]